METNDKISSEQFQFFETIFHDVIVAQNVEIGYLYLGARKIDRQWGRLVVSKGKNENLADSFIIIGQKGLIGP